MKKIFTLFAAVVCGLAVNAKTIYLNGGGNALWNQADAVFFVHAWSSSEAYQDLQMSQVSGDVYSVDINDDYNNIIFLREAPGATQVEWSGDKFWNKTGDLEIPSDKNLFTMTSWDNGEWSVYGEGGGGGQPQPQGDHDYYLKGYRGPSKGDIETPTMDEYFECGKLENYSYEGDPMLGKGHFFILVCDPGQTIGVCYMSKGDVDGTHCTLYNQNETPGADGKLMINPPSATFYLYDNGDGTLELSIEELAGKTLVGNCGGGGSTPGEQEAVENTKAVVKARKAIIDGRLVIIRGEKMFDATGRAL